MASRSSTSAFSRVPWAAVLAAVIVLATDALFFGDLGPWDRLARDVEFPIARSRRELRDVRTAPDDKARVLIVGTSRAQFAFDVETARKAVPSAAFAMLAHPNFEPFVIRSLADEMIDYGADVVVLFLSEFETHRPLRFNRVPGNSAGSLTAIVDLIDIAGLEFAVRHRDTLYRLILSSGLDMYRFRKTVHRGGLDEYRLFALNDRLMLRPDYPEAKDLYGPIAVWEGLRRIVPAEAKRSTLDLFPPEMPDMAGKSQAGQAAEVTAGRHAAIKLELVRRTVATLRDAGIDVIIVECPIHPATHDLYEPELRDEFVALAERVRSEEGAVFVGLEAIGPFAESDFTDLTHVSGEGQAKLTRAVLATLDTVLRARGEAR